MAVLVTGGAGYIGSHTVLKLIGAGRDVVIADNYSNSSPKAVGRLEELTGRQIPVARRDLAEPGAADAIFDAYGIDSVVHFAGLKAVGESVQKPLEYYKNNLFSTLCLLDAMKRRNIFDFVFSSSATVYGDPATVPITEGFPLSATNPYGQTKLMIENILRDLHAADARWNIAILRYFNPIGAHPSGRIGEDPAGIPNNLLPYIAQVAIGRLKEVVVFGNDYPTRDGTGVRDYIHVEDLARGHADALRWLQETGGLLTVNLGTGTGYSVLEIIGAFEKACGREIPRRIAARRPGDIAACYADPSRAASELGWRAELSLDDMCRSVWNWQRNNPDGYR